MKFTGEGIRQKLKKKKPYYYEPLTMEGLEKFLKDINRHKLRDGKGRFKKKPIKIMLGNAYYKYTV